DALTLTFAALADPTRRAILQRLAQGDAVVKDIALPFPMSSPAVSKHLRVLERAGLIERGRQAQWRPRRLVGQPLGEAAAWLHDYRQFWLERFDRMDELLQQMQADAAPAAKAKAKAKPKPATRQPRSRKTS